MKEAASVFEKARGVKVEVTAGPTTNWLDKAKQDADLIYSGSGTIMTDLVYAMKGQLDHRQVYSLYLRPLAILVRPGNPRKIAGLRHLHGALWHLQESAVLRGCRKVDDAGTRRLGGGQ